MSKASPPACNNIIPQLLSIKRVGGYHIEPGVYAQYMNIIIIMHAKEGWISVVKLSIQIFAGQADSAHFGICQTERIVSIAVKYS